MGEPASEMVEAGRVAAPHKPHPEPVGLLLLALALLFNAILLAPEARIERVPVNDLPFHVEAAQRLGQSIAHGEPLLDPWVSQWSLGYPLWRVYQPLPHLLAAAVIAFARPFVAPAVSFAALYYVLLAMLPASVYLGARLLGLNPLAAGLGSILILAPSEAGDFSRYGLSYGAFVWRGSGLFTELVALEILLPALGLTARALDRSAGLGAGTRRQTSAALALALTAMAHIFFGYIAVLSMAVWALFSPSEGRARRIARAVSIAGMAMLLLAWFVVPMVLAGGEVNRSRWDPAYKFDSYGAPVILTELFSGRLLDFGRLPVLSLMVAAGALIAAFNIGDSLARRLLALTGFWLALYFGRETWGHLLVLVGIPSQFHLHRLESAFELFAVLLAAWGLERIVARAIRAPATIGIAVGAVAGAALLLMASERAEYLRLNTVWGERNLAAFRGERGDLELAVADVRAILAERPGRVSAGKAADWGGTFKIGEAEVYSFLTRDGLDQASYLYHTISRTSDFMVLRDENNADHESFFAIRAVLAPAALKLPAFFRMRSVHGRFAVYEVSDEGYFGLVDIGARYDGPASTRFEPVSQWLHSWMLRAGEVIALDPRRRRPRVSGVPQIGRWQPLPNPAMQFMRPRGRIVAESKLLETYHASIDVERPCYALIKITYHPDLAASVDGQREPLYRVSPGFGAIPLTTGHHEVEVRYQPGPLKPLLLIAGIVLFVLAARPSLGTAWERSERWLEGRLVVWGEWLATDRAKTALGLGVLVLLFTRALFRGQLIDGHDSLAYPPRLTEFARILGEHQLPPMWAPDLSYGHGQPLFEFFPPLAYVAALSFFKSGLGLADSFQFALAILFAMGAVAVYLLGRQMSFSRIASIGGSAAWLFAPYHALDLYVSVRFAESCAVAVAPIALLGLMTALERSTPVSIVLGAAAIALVPLAHNAVALLMLPVFAAIVVARSAIAERPLRTAAAGACAMAGGLGLSAYYWLPSLAEKQFTKTDLAGRGFFNWSVHIISPIQLIWGRWGFGYSVPGPNDGISFSLGLVHIALAIAGVLIAIRALDRKRLVDAMVFAGAALAGAWLATEWSSPVWAHVSILQNFQFPWRTLSVPALFMPLLALYAFERLGPKAGIVVIMLIVLVNLHHTQPKGYLTFDEEYYGPASIAEKGLETTMYWAEPRWVQVRRQYTGDRLTSDRSLSLKARVLASTATRHVYSVEAPAAATVASSTFYFPGWTVLIDGRETAISPQPVFGMISFEVPAGSHIIAMELRPTPVRRFALDVSIVTLAALLLAVAAGLVGGTRKP